MGQCEHDKDFLAVLCFDFQVCYLPVDPFGRPLVAFRLVPLVSRHPLVSFAMAASHVVRRLRFYNPQKSYHSYIARRYNLHFGEVGGYGARRAFTNSLLKEMNVQ